MVVTTSVNGNSMPDKADIINLAKRVGLDHKKAMFIYDEMEKTVRTNEISMLDCIS